MDQFELKHSDTTLPSKAAVVRALLRLEGGATLNEIMNATGWKACSCRSFLTSQRKHRRYKLMRSKIDGVTTAAITGQLAGALFGTSSIPHPRRTSIAKRIGLLIRGIEHCNAMLPERYRCDVQAFLKDEGF
ncbi:DUF3489 domain-containing protein [Novosphingobium sp.]|uniref:DUF3489 domain-containing protein n=1 Tax=Novosphingobium sp. TaxID=1874826 RepID=UPI0035B2D65D